MSAPDRKRYTLTADRSAVLRHVERALDGWTVTIAPPGRSLDQNALWHAMLDELAKKCPTYAGQTLDAAAWKQLIKVSFTQAEREANGDARPIVLVPDLEGTGLVQICEQSSCMSKARGSALIDYTMKIAAERGVILTDTRHGDAR